MSAVVRPIRPSDANALNEFVWAEREELNRAPWDRRDLEKELLSGAMFGMKTLVAVDGDQILGIVALRRGKSVRSRHTAMLRLHVRAEYRSNGVGAKLLRRALFWADRNGITRTVAMPYVKSVGWDFFMPDYSKSVQFFKPFGFKYEGVQKKAAQLLDGSFTDVALMARVT